MDSDQFTAHGCACAADGTSAAPLPHSHYARQAGETPLETHGTPLVSWPPHGPLRQPYGLCARHETGGVELSQHPDRHTRSRDPLRRRRSPRRPRDRAVRRARRSLARKLLPGLFHLDRAGLMPARYRIIGTSRKGGSAEDFREVARRRRSATRRGRDVGALRAAARRSAPSAPTTPAPLVEAVAEAREGARRRAAPAALPLDPARRVRRHGRGARRRRALGRARAWCSRSRSASTSRARVALNALVHGVFPEERVFRIDHFLGREAVQNLIALRFANGMFEPIWNRDHIDHVQIDVPETLAGRRPRRLLRGHRRLPRHGRHAPLPRARLRGHGAADRARRRARSSRRPARSSARSRRSSPNCVIRGQYAGYREGKGVDPDSQTETFIAHARRDRQLALVGRAVLPAHRQAHGRVSGGC